MLHARTVETVILVLSRRTRRIVSQSPVCIEPPFARASVLHTGALLRGLSWYDFPSIAFIRQAKQLNIAECWRTTYLPPGHNHLQRSNCRASVYFLHTDNHERFLRGLSVLRGWRPCRDGSVCGRSARGNSGHLSHRNMFLPIQMLFKPRCHGYRIDRALVALKGERCTTHAFPVC